VPRLEEEEQHEDGVQGLLHPVFFLWEKSMYTFCKNNTLPAPSERSRWSGDHVVTGRGS
jgi:hypothetical protein